MYPIRLPVPSCFLQQDQMPRQAHNIQIQRAAAIKSFSDCIIVKHSKQDEIDIRRPARHGGLPGPGGPGMKRQSQFCRAQELKAAAFPWPLISS
jgi:hypothetical protein